MDSILLLLQLPARNGIETTYRSRIRWLIYVRRISQQDTMWTSSLAHNTFNLSRSFRTFGLLTHYAVRNHSFATSYKSAIADITVHPSDICLIHNTYVTLGYYQTKKVELLERGYTVVEGTADPTNNTLLGGSTLPLNFSAPIQTETQDLFHDAVHTSLDKESALSRTEASKWYSIFNNAD